jgi:hypothetical protein
VNTAPAAVRETGDWQDPGMNGTRKAGLIVAGIGAATWLGALAAFLGTGPEDGVNIGGAFLALLAVPVSVGASVTLLASLRGESSGASGTLRAGAGFAVVAVLAMLAFLVIDPYGESATVQFPVLGVGILAFFASSGLFAAASRSTGRQLHLGR